LTAGTDADRKAASACHCRSPTALGNSCCHQIKVTCGSCTVCVYHQVNHRPHTGSGSWQVANIPSKCLTLSTDRYAECTDLCPGIILQDKLTIYEDLTVQAGSLPGRSSPHRSLHMQLPARGSPSDSLATLDIAVEQVELSYSYLVRGVKSSRCLQSPKWPCRLQGSGLLRSLLHSHGQRSQ